MATPRVKRAFAGAASDPAQRQITSFFGRDEAPAPAPGDRPAFERRSSTPLLPPSVQANLLAVGMRVRKSVPEGYKRGKEEAAATTTTAAAAPSVSLYSRCAAPARRELTPFCGLHKIGGLGVQSFGDGDDGDDDNGRPLFDETAFCGAEDDAAQPPGLTSSQETVASTASTASSAAWSRPQPRFAGAPRFSSTGLASPASTRKRFHGEDGEHDIHVHIDSATPPVSSSVNRWLSSGHAGAAAASGHDSLGRRVLAVPRRRQRSGLHAHALHKPAEGAGGFVDQENVQVMGDFDEADFLVHDLEMGGMAGV